MILTKNQITIDILLKKINDLFIVFIIRIKYTTISIRPNNHIKDSLIKT